MKGVSNKRVAVVGDRGSVIGFRGMAMETRVIEEEGEAQAVLAELIEQGECAVIFVTEQVAEEAEEIIAAQRYKPLPAIVSIPSAGSFMGKGQAQINEAVKKAIGFNILGDWTQTPEDN